jgi:hypothetical protein
MKVDEKPARWEERVELNTYQSFGALICAQDHFVHKSLAII